MLTPALGLEYQRYIELCQSHCVNNMQRRRILTTQPMTESRESGNDNRIMIILNIITQAFTYRADNTTHFVVLTLHE